MRREQVLAIIADFYGEDWDWEHMLTNPEQIADCHAEIDRRSEIDRLRQEQELDEA